MDTSKTSTLQPCCGMTHTREGFQFWCSDTGQNSAVLRQLLNSALQRFPFHGEAAQTILTVSHKTAYLILQTPPAGKETRRTCDLQCFRLEAPAADAELTDEEAAECGRLLAHLTQSPQSDYLYNDLDQMTAVYAHTAALLPALPVLEQRMTCRAVCGTPSGVPPVSLLHLKLFAALLEQEHAALSQAVISQTAALASALIEISRCRSLVQILSFRERTAVPEKHLRCISRRFPEIAPYAKLLCAANGDAVTLSLPGSIPADTIAAYYMTLSECTAEDAAGIENILLSCERICLSDGTRAMAEQFLAAHRGSAEWAVRAAFLCEILRLPRTHLAGMTNNPDICRHLLTMLSAASQERPAAAFLRRRWRLASPETIDPSLAARMFFWCLMSEREYLRVFPNTAQASAALSELLTLGWEPRRALQKKRIYRLAIRQQLWTQLRASASELLHLLHQLAESYFGRCRL